MGKDQQTWQMFSEYAKSSDGSLVHQVRKAAKDTSLIKKQRQMSTIDEQHPDNNFSVPEKNYLEIIEKNKLKMTDDRIADFRQTLSEMVAVKNGVIPSDSQNIFKSPKNN